jgi:acetyl-CoA synthetase
MTPTEAFERARNTLLRHRDDLERARAEFTWPIVEEFNWAWDWFEVVARGNDKTALVLVNETGSVAQRSFATLAERSTRLGRWLRDHGVERGDRILVMLSNVIPLWETMLAAMKIGAVVIPATTQLTETDVDDRLVRGNIRHIIADEPSTAKVRNPERLHVRLAVDRAPGFTPYEDAFAARATLEPLRTRSSDPLLLYFTSGTTAKPKLVLHTHRSYPIGHLSTMYWLGLREGDTHQNISSPGWAKHAWSSFFAPWNAGATILAHNTMRFVPADTIAILRDHHVSTLCAPPTVWRKLILENLGARPSCLEELTSAGEPLNPEVIETVQDAWGITIRDGYGQTETTAQIGNPPGLSVKPGSMGMPLPGYDIAFLDSQGRESDEGELAIRLAPRPAGLMDGYLDDDERTKLVMAEGYYRTGDEARRDKAGYIHFIGRGDDVFKSSDYRISPFELESVLLEHDVVAEAAIVPSPDPIRWLVPKAYVTLKPGVPETHATAHAIFDYCSQHLPPYKRIRCIEFASLPKTISGKIRRVELRTIEAERRANNERGESEFWLDEGRNR